MKKRFVLPVLILIFVSLGFALWLKEGMLPVDKNDKKPLIFIIAKGDSINTIARNLENERLIRNKIVFFLLVKKLGIEKKIQAGDYRLNRNMNTEELAQELTHGTLDIWVTLLEGWRKEEVAQALSASHQISELLFIQKAREGYLFPDTYLIPKNADASLVLRVIESNFQQKLNKSLIKKAESLGYSLNELLTIASLVERETKDKESRRMVAGIILNRLEIDMPLQIDATVQYALGYSEKEKTWWRKNLTSADLQVESLYNTYQNPGLPPGPICSPGLDSILAVLEAKKSNYLYYISDAQGVMHYAKTLEEHNQNIKKYLN